MVEDFYTALVFPNAFDFQAMPPQWQIAQRKLSVSYRRMEWKLKVQTLQMIGRSAAKR